MNWVLICNSKLRYILKARGNSKNAKNAANLRLTQQNLTQKLKKFLSKSQMGWRGPPTDLSEPIYESGQLSKTPYFQALFLTYLVPWSRPAGVSKPSFFMGNPPRSLLALSSASSLRSSLWPWDEKVGALFFSSSCAFFPVTTSLLLDLL